MCGGADRRQWENGYSRQDDRDRTGTIVYYAGGGGAGSKAYGYGGSGINGLGGGGGAGAAGGSGVVIVRYYSPVATPSPGNFRYAEIGSNHVALAWDAPVGGSMVDYYEISNGPGPLVFSEGNQTTFLWSGLNFLTNYTFQVRAVDTAGNRSGWTTLANVATSAAGVPSGASRWIDLSRTDPIAGTTNSIDTPPDGILDEVIGVDQNRFAASVVESTWSYPFNNFWTLWGVTWPDGSFTPNFTFSLMMQPYWDYEAPTTTETTVDLSFRPEPGQEYAILFDDSEGHVFNPANAVQNSYPTSFPSATLQHIYLPLGLEQLQFAKFYLVRYGKPIGSVNFGFLPATMTLGTGTITVPGLGTVSTSGTGTVLVPAGASAVLSAKDVVNKVLQAGPRVIWEVWDQTSVKRPSCREG
ncbi:MAG: fibronectin type III domain-containing protein, partial [Opitutaceae bacterium]